MYIDPESPARITRTRMMFDIAATVARRSTCGRRQVGAVLARDGRIISIGYAGAPAGQPHCSSAICDLSKPCTRTIHAEVNAIAYAARAGVSTENAELFCTLSPCIECAKVIISAGIRSVYYLDRYRDYAGIKLMVSSGLEVQHGP